MVSVSILTNKITSVEDRFVPELSFSFGLLIPHKIHFTESQNHRMVGVGRDLCGSSSSTPPLTTTKSKICKTLAKARILALPTKHPLPKTSVKNSRCFSFGSVLMHFNVTLCVIKLIACDLRQWSL